MEIIKEEAITLQELLSWLDKRRGGSKWWPTSDQRELASYAEEYKKLGAEQEEKLLTKLIEEINIPREIAVQIVSTLPLIIDEVTPFLKQLKEKRELSSAEEKEKTREILQATREIWRKKHSASV